MRDRSIQIEKIKQIRNNLKYQKLNLGKEQIEDYILNYGSDCYVELEKAKYYHYSKDYTKAEEIINNLININPKNIGYVLYELGRIYEEQEKYDEALEAYKRIEETNHKEKEYAYFSIGNIYERLTNHEQAICYFEKAVFPHSRFNEDAKMHIAKNYIYLKQYDKARAYLKNVLTHNDPKLACHVLFYKARIELSTRNYSKYVEMIDELITRYPSFHPAIAEKVKILFEQKKYNEGKNFLKKIHVSNASKSDHCGYKILSAEYYEKIFEHAKALEIYEDLLTNYTDTLRPLEKSRAMIGIATCYVGIGNIEKGYEYFKKQSETDIAYANACLFNMISIDIYLGNYERAYEILKQIDNDGLDSKIDVTDLKLVLSKFIDIEPPIINAPSYREKQLLTYEKKLAYDHIYEGHSIEKAPSDEGAFADNIDIYNLIDDIKEKLDEKSIVGLNVFKKHKLYYENIGVFDGENLNYLVVITPLYSNDIITMYPTNELLEEKMEVKPKQKIIKRVSQIEKFNRRYNKK